MVIWPNLRPMQLRSPKLKGAKAKYSTGVYPSALGSHRRGLCVGGALALDSRSKVVCRAGWHYILKIIKKIIIIIIIIKQKQKSTYLKASGSG